MPFPATAAIFCAFLRRQLIAVFLFTFAPVSRDNPEVKRKWTHVCSQLFYAAVSFCAIRLYAAGVAEANQTAPARFFPQCGYYLLLMRTPTFGFEAWKDIVDCVAEDGADFIVLWMGGGFRSEKFPVTWQYNRSTRT